MPKLSDLSNSALVKLAYIGDSGTGKTGSLASLAKAGYKLRVLNVDNNIGVLAQYVQKECPEMLGNIEQVTFSDTLTMTSTGPIINGTPMAYVNTLKALTKWEDGSKPCEWGPDYILVLDTLTHLGRAAFEWARGMNPHAKDPRQWYHTGQQSLFQIMDMLKSAAFATNVIVISHVDYDESEEGFKKGYMKGLGKAMGPILPSFFGTLIMAKTEGVEPNIRRVIKTVPTNLVDLKTAAPFKIAQTLPLESGMATIFQQLKAL